MTRRFDAAELARLGCGKAGIYSLLKSNLGWQVGYGGLPMCEYTWTHDMKRHCWIRNDGVVIADVAIAQMDAYSQGLLLQVLREMEPKQGQGGQLQIVHSVGRVEVDDEGKGDDDTPPPSVA